MLQKIFIDGSDMVSFLFKLPNDFMVNRNQHMIAHNKRN